MNLLLAQLSRLAALIFTIMFAILLASPTAASAEEADWYRVTTDLKVRTGPHLDSPVMGKVFKDEMVQVLCQDIGENVNNNMYWDFIQYEVDSLPGMVKRGYVADDYVHTGVDGRLPNVRWRHCPEPLTKPGEPIDKPSVKPYPRPTPPAPPGPQPGGVELQYHPDFRGCVRYVCFYYQSGTVVLAGWDPSSWLTIKWTYTLRPQGDDEPVIYHEQTTDCPARGGCTSHSDKVDTLHEEYLPGFPPEYCIHVSVSGTNGPVSVSAPPVPPACHTPPRF
jgi:hypothetical protein